MRVPDDIRKLFTRITWTELDCWEWQGARTKGYGVTSRTAGTRLVHRLVYEATRSPVPDGMQLDHLCRNRACCNPHHLEPVTNRENALRGAKATKTECLRGHSRWGNNSGRRYCLDCHAERQRNRYRSQPTRADLIEAAL